MLNFNFKISEISKILFCLFVIFFSITVVAIRVKKLNWNKLFDKFCLFTVKTSTPEIFLINKKFCVFRQSDEFQNNEPHENIEQDVEIGETTHSEKENLESASNFRILETQFGNSGIKCDNFYIKNKTGKEINFDKYLNKKPKIAVRNNKIPTVLIYHTHTSESYMEKDELFFPKDFYARTQDTDKNIVAVGKELEKTLKNYGISVKHDTTVHDFPKYNGAYGRSALTVKKYLNKNHQIPMVIDIHRDSMGENKNGRIKPIFKTKNNKKAAQIMFVCGCGIDKSLKFPNWEKNLSLALNLQKICEKKFPGLTRELFIKNSVYNQNLTPNAMLIEIGSDMNTLEESKLSARMLGESIYDFLKK